jgi:hypothetical protein
MEVKELVRWAMECKEQGVEVDQETDGWIVFRMMGEWWIWGHHHHPICARKNGMMMYTRLFYSV